MKPSSGARAVPRAISLRGALGALALCSAILSAPAQDVVSLPERGALKIARSVRLARGEHVRPAPPDGALMRAEGLVDAEIDLTGAVVRGAPRGTPLERCAGIGLLLRHCRRVKVLGGTFSGFRGCIVAEGCQDLSIEGARFDGFFGTRLRSTPAAEDERDWLWPHENDEGQWLERYGAAISLSDCRGATVSSCRARHGQNGLLLTRSSAVRAYDNDFSFLSGWGVALYRSSGNVISHNSLDYCVRGYGHGVYWRGQDSAAILLFEQSSDNVVGLNSATHSGDGVFLFAGRDIVEGKAWERGEEQAGGSDRNLFFENDFSYAVANGIEATFSRDNRAYDNVIRSCHQHAVWGGYSHRLVLVGNQLVETRGGAVSIEHGQECFLARNLIEKNEIGLELWWDEDEAFVGGPFGRRFDTASRDVFVLGNAFDQNVADLRIQRTSGLGFAFNVFSSEAGELSAATLAPFEGQGAGRPSGPRAGEQSPVEGQAGPRERLRGIGGFLPGGSIADSTIRAWDGTPLPEMEQALAFEPPEVPGSRAAVGALDRARVGLESIVIGEWGPWDWPSGEPRPQARAAGGALAGARWDARWFSWRDGPDPRGSGEALEAWRALAAVPLQRAEVRAWTTPWGGEAAIERAVGSDRFGLIASAEVDLEGGRYRLSTRSDDGVRLVLDGVTVLENWTWHAATRDEVELDLAQGSHRFVLEYFQLDGGSALAVDLERLGGE